MKYSFKWTLLQCIIVSILYSSQSIENSKLILVHGIFRHGARTTDEFYPNDPHKNNSFYPVGLGGLTNSGKQGEFLLGRLLRKLYENFLDDIYTEDIIEIRSTDVTRTKMSAQLVMAGLFPPNKIQEWNPLIMWQPIPISYKSKSQEDIFHPIYCPFRETILKEQLNNSVVYNLYIEPFKDVYSFIEKKSKKSIKRPKDVLDFYSILKCESDLNLTLPEWTKRVFPEPLESIGSLDYSYSNYNPQVKIINSGYMLEKILQDTHEKIENLSSPRKMFLYSGHESTVGYMLNALDVYKVNKIPPYGSIILFEIWKSELEYFIKIRYRNDTDAIELLDLQIPECDLFCPLNTFIELKKDLLPTIGIQDACITLI